MDNMDYNLRLVLYPGETVRPIEGFEGYLVTSTGRVLSAKKKVTTTTLDNKVYECIIYKELKASIVRGYKTVNLSSNKTRKKFYVHELVLNNFLGQFDKAYFKIKHINNNKLDNRLENLALEFRRKDQQFIDKYIYQSKLLRCLKEY